MGDKGRKAKLRGDKQKKASSDAGAKKAKEKRDRQRGKSGLTSPAKGKG